ncbi:M14 family metallopeptidase [Actinomycetospora cinnamomea]|uniref:Zinc carboxypeptidase n=1 Tax=Actinomycetospora cinnamomea TaxID=663609 RepID=A0A2U1F843_9PSEU|nr:M14 family metallopeptidase [Actinomycetospora cinnamomea]PVZ08150.1 carboxypeptidase T [Actinomycetospora cinnamomea]
MTIIVRITATAPRLSMQRVLDATLGLDVWEVHDDHVVALATEPQAERLLAMGYGVEELAGAEAFVTQFGDEAAAAAYHSAQSLEDDLRRLSEEHPEVAELREIGRSVEGRPIWALRVGIRRGEQRDGTTTFLVLGCHHAREWLAVEVPYLLASHLVTAAGEEPVASWLEQGEVWVAPMVNPDGHEYTRTHDRLWRKNRRPNPDGTVGVDPNRNYGYMWGTLDVATSSHVPADATYVGPRAFSEPEVRAVRDLVAREQVAGVLTYHSYSQLILYPWGYTPDPVPDGTDRQQMTAIGQEMQRLIHDVHGRTYTAKQSSDLYPTAGDTADWTYGENDAPSLTIELRPAGQADGGFVLPPSQIQPAWEENREAALHFIGQILGKP